MNLEVITDYVKEYCPEFVGKDNVNLFTVLYALAEEREAIKKHREFMCSMGRFLGGGGGSDFLAFCTEVGTINDEKNGFSFVLLATLNGTPAIACKETGRTFVFLWEGLARLAVRCGVALDKKAS